MQTINRTSFLADAIQPGLRFQPGLVHDCGPSFVGLPLRRILVPIDFSDCSIEALRRALPLARLYGASISLLHVRPAESADADFPNHLDSLEAQIRESYARALATIAREEIPDDIGTRTVVRIGRPSSEIVAEASATNIDLIVLAAHGYNGFRAGPEGSTAEQVKDSANCPVLVIEEAEQWADHVPELAIYA